MRMRMSKYTKERDGVLTRDISTSFVKKKSRVIDVLKSLD